MVAHAPAERPSAASLFAAARAGAEASSSSRAAGARDDDGEDDPDDPLAPKRPAGPPLAASWLRRWLARAAAVTDPALSAAVAAAVLNPALTDDALGAELVGVVGDSAFAAVAALVAVRSRLAAGLRAAVAAARGADDDARSATASGPLGPGVTVATAAERDAARAARKASRRVAKGAAAGADPDTTWIAAHGVDGLADEEEAAAAGAADGFVAAPGAAPRGDPRSALPAGTQRITRKGYEELRIPPSAQRPPDEPLVPISALPPWAQPAFAGMTSLNRIQSRIFPVAFGQGCNMLVCAPTGAGKTNVAMLAVLREVGAALRGRGAEGAAASRPGRRSTPAIPAADFKVVYVAPMKALAAEVTAAFSRRLAPLGLAVRELTGDVQLSRRELASTHMIVTTPEKWDVVTRKGGDTAAAAALRLIIIDEVHLLNDDRGAVIETLVARTHRTVETSQRLIRVVGLSATLPNHRDVAGFLGAPPAGTFHFDATFRPVPLEMAFIGVADRNMQAARAAMDGAAADKVADALRRGHQAMVFVHSRKDTGRTARALADLIAKAGASPALRCDDHPRFALASRDVARSRDRELADLFPAGLAIHHAGMLRPDRTLVERLFADGCVKVLVCTATLAWGVNLPAHTVVIKGTQLYNPQKGGYVNLGMLDVQQIFGRAGRPQFDDSGEAILITGAETLPHYLGLLTHATPIESQFVPGLADNLGAELVLGSVASVAEGAAWLRYSYLHVRMTRNPLAYGVSWAELGADPTLEGRRRSLVEEAAGELVAARMARHDRATGRLAPTDLGRVASHFYVKVATVRVINERLKPGLGEGDALSLLARASEFDQVAVRDDEAAELDALTRDACPYDVGVRVIGGGGGERAFGGKPGMGPANDRSAAGPSAAAADAAAAAALDRAAKVSILLQAFIGRVRLASFSLTADQNYAAANAPRLARALFETALARGWPVAADTALTLCKAFERRLWPHAHPLWQCEGRGRVSADVLRRLDEGNASLDVLADMTPDAIGAMLRNPAAGASVADAVASFPHLALAARLQPLAAGVLRVALDITPAFRWVDALHGGSMRWHVWVETGDGGELVHAEVWSLGREAGGARAPTTLTFTVPLPDPPPSHYYVRCISDEWLGAEIVLRLPLDGVVPPAGDDAPAELLDLDPLPVAALAWRAAERALGFLAFNRVQAHAFHALYHTDAPSLVTAPPRAGAGALVDLALLRLLRSRLAARGVDVGLGGAVGGSSAAPPRPAPPPTLGGAALVLAPLPALARARAADWRSRFGRGLGARVLEVGEGGPALSAADVGAADVVVSTPSAWAAATRAWPDADLAASVSLLVLEEAHLVGAPGGGAVDAVVSRARAAAARARSPLRLFALAPPLARPTDVAAWIGADPTSTFAFGQSARPVPLEARVRGFPGAHAAPRAAAMTKPAYDAIVAHAPAAPVIVFVGSRAQARTTALDLIACASADDAPRRWARAASDAALDTAAAAARDPALRHCLAFGVALHHDGMGDADREAALALFRSGAARLLVATRSLAWAPPPPAALVIVKGTDAYDACAGRYVEAGVEEVLRAAACAGRAGLDAAGVAVVMVADARKDFYKRFLLEPPPVESALAESLSDDFLLPAIAAGALTTRQASLDLLTWTYLFRRCVANPSYYGLVGRGREEVGQGLSALADGALRALAAAGCIDLAGDGSPGDAVAITPLGASACASGLRAAAAARVAARVPAAGHFRGALDLVAACLDPADVPARHGDADAGARLASGTRFGPPRGGLRSEVKASLLLQRHLGRLPFPHADAAADARRVLLAAAAVPPFAVGAAARAALAAPALAAAALGQCLAQGMWPDDPPGLQLPGVDRGAADALGAAAASARVRLAGLAPDAAAAALAGAGVGPRAADAAVAALGRMPDVRVAWRVVAAASATAGPTLTLAVDRRPGATAPPNSPPPRAIAPRWPASRDEGWTALAVDARGALLAAARLGALAGSATLEMSLKPSQAPERGIDVYLVSDAYVGADACCALPPSALPNASGFSTPWSAAAASAVGEAAVVGAVQTAATVVVVEARGGDGGDDGDFDDAPGGT